MRMRLIVNVILMYVLSLVLSQYLLPPSSNRLHFRIPNSILHVFPVFPEFNSKCIVLCVAYYVKTDHVIIEEVLLKVNEQRNILHEIRKRKANWIGHILRRNCLLQQVIEGKIKGQIEVTRRRGRRRKQLLDDLKDRRGYCQLKEEALDRTMWRNRFGRGFGPVV